MKVASLAVVGLLALIQLAQVTVHGAPVTALTGVGMCQGIAKAMDLDDQILAIRRAQTNITCVECLKMVDVLQDFCQVHDANSRPYPQQFEDLCFDKTLKSSTGYETLRGKCSTFYSFIASLYCPLDPCTQITTQAMHAPTAICDLMKCAAIPDHSIPAKVFVPWDCPYYVQEISKECAKTQIEVGKVSNVTAQSLCQHLPEKFIREGCELTYEALSAAVYPQPMCSSALCSDSNLTKTCQDIGFPLNTSVPLREYQEWVYAHSDDCRSTAYLNIVSATFGENCDARLADNILESVQKHCQGKKQCTFGNQDLPGLTSEYNPVAGRSACSPEFTVVYHCGASGKLRSITATESAKYMAVPIKCPSEPVKLAAGSAAPGTA